MSIFDKDLLSQLSIVTDTAIAKGHVKWTESEILHLPPTSSGYAFEITFAPQLGAKPKLAQGDSAAKPSKPFEPPYPPDAFVAEGRDDAEGEEFVILLNKFMVAKRHCLLITKDFEPQTQPPTPRMMHIAYEVLRSFELQGSHWQGIYNCGSQSGASQPHRHLQLIPLRGELSPFERLLQDSREQAKDSILSLSSLPYANFIVRLSPASDLGASLFLLLNAMHEYFVHSSHHRKSEISYNLVLTTRYLLLVPRSEADAGLGQGVSPLSVNALAYSGCVLVKDEQQLDKVKALGGQGMLELIGKCSYESAPRPPHQDAELEDGD